MIASRDGCPLRIILCPGKEHDSVPFKFMVRNLPKGSKIYGDSAYLDYEYQDRLMESEKIKMIAEPKSNTTRVIDLHDYVNLKYTRVIDLHDYVNLKYIRKFIEGAFGVISRLMPRKIHAVTPEGVEVKVVGFLIAAAMNFITN